MPLCVGCVEAVCQKVVQQRRRQIRLGAVWVVKIKYHSLMLYIEIGFGCFPFVAKQVVHQVAQGEMFRRWIGDYAVKTFEDLQGLFGFVFIEQAQDIERLEQMPVFRVFEYVVGYGKDIVDGFVA